MQDIKAKFLGALAERGYQYKNGKVTAAVPDEKEKTAEAVDEGLTGEVKYKYDKAWKGYRLQWAAKAGSENARGKIRKPDAAETHFPKKKTPTERKNLCGRLDKAKRMCYNIKAFGKRRGFQNENPRKNRTASGCGAVGSALPWGGRGRTFKSCHSDQIKPSGKSRVALFVLHGII